MKGATNLTPEYVKLLRDLQKNGGRIRISTEISQIQNRLGTYVLMYDNEAKIGRALLLFFLGEEGYKTFNSDLEAAPAEEQRQFLDEMAEFDPDSVEEFASFEIPQSPEEWKSAREAAASLPDEERREAEQRGIFFGCFIFSSFFNTLALMVHGSRMTTLVPQAIAGDDDAFLKAVQIDRMLLIHHPYFRDRKLRAQNGDEPEFLRKLSYREANPSLRGKIQYPGLYMLFGILDSYRWLDDLKHEEILDICDAAGLDRYQNRIEDVNYLTKRLLEYRRFQKSSGLSMH